MKLENKVAVITGGVRGIGRQIALLFVREGAKVAVNDVNEDAGTGEKVLSTEEIVIEEMAIDGICGVY